MNLLRLIIKGNVMNLNELSERRYLKVSKYKRKRIKQLKKLLEVLDNYQPQVKTLIYHKKRVEIVKLFLNSEVKGKRKDLQNLLTSMMIKILPIEDENHRYFQELKVAMLYNYLHRNEVSHL